MPKKKIFAVSFPGKSPLKLKQCQKNRTPAASTAGHYPTIIGLMNLKMLSLFIFHLLQSSAYPNQTALRAV